MADAAQLQCCSSCTRRILRSAGRCLTHLHAESIQQGRQSPPPPLWSWPACGSGKRCSLLAAIPGHIHNHRRWAGRSENSDASGGRGMLEGGCVCRVRGLLRRGPVPAGGSQTDAGSLPRRRRRLGLARVACWRDAPSDEIARCLHFTSLQLTHCICVHMNYRTYHQDHLDITAFTSHHEPFLRYHGSLGLSGDKCGLTFL